MAEKTGMAAAVAICMKEQDDLVGAADEETATDLLGAPVEARGPGRPAGSLNKATRQEVAAIRASGQSPLAFLASLWRDPGKSDKTRKEAAVAALPYFHKKQPLAIDGGASGLRVAIVMPGMAAETAEFLDLDADDIEFEEIQ